jgi:hypothetical protein
MQEALLDEVEDHSQIPVPSYLQPISDEIVATWLKSIFKRKKNLATGPGKDKRIFAEQTVNTQ